MNFSIESETQWILAKYAKESSVPRGENAILDMGYGSGTFGGKERKLRWRTFGIVMTARFFKVGAVVKALFKGQPPILAGLQATAWATLPKVLPSS